MALRRKRVLVVAIAALLTAGALGATPAQAADPLAGLRTQIAKALRDSTSHALGYYVTISGIPGSVQHNANTALIPASNQKIFTALADLMQLTPTGQLVTTVRRTGWVIDGTLHGALILRGAGDPLLSNYALRAMAKGVVAARIKTVTGALWADDTRYDRLRSAPGWKRYYVPEDSGPLSALAVGENGWRRDRAYIRDPARPNADRFRAALEQAGVHVLGPTRLGRPFVLGTLVTVHYSRTIASLVRQMLKVSDNFMAEEMLKELGAGDRVQGTTASGLSVVRRWAARLGVRIGRAYDGSGLSWWDRESPWQEAAWLRVAERSDVGPEFVAALPIACVDGTLEHRFCGTRAAGRVFAKTGTLPGVVCLAGYTTTVSGRHVRFAFMLNANASNLAARRAVDRAVLAIAGFAG